MSKSNIKGKNEKGGKSSNNPTPAVTHEIVPGKFNDQDWFNMLDKDNGDEFILDIVEDLIGDVLLKIFDKNLAKQLIPFAVLRAKEDMLDIVQWQYLTMDLGEEMSEGNTSWIADDEPTRMLTDNWAQGAIPQIVTRSDTFILDNIEDKDDNEYHTIYENEAESEAAEITEAADIVNEDEEITVDKENSNDNNNNAVENDNIDGDGDEDIITKETTETSEEIIESREPSPIVVKPPAKKKKKKFKPYTGVLKNDSLNSITTPLDKSDAESDVRSSLLKHEQVYCAMPISCQSLVRLQAGRPPGHRDVEFDKFGNVTSMAKIDLSSSHNRRVNLPYHIIDPLMEATIKKQDITSRNKADKKKSQQNSFRNKDTNEIMRAIQPKIKTKTMIRDTTGPITTRVAINKEKKFDQMEANVGVVIYENGRTKTGPRERIRKHPATSKLTNELRPLQLRSLSSEFCVNDVVSNAVVNETIINNLPTVPPINQAGLV